MLCVAKFIPPPDSQLTIIVAIPLIMVLIMLCAWARDTLPVEEKKTAVFTSQLLQLKSIAEQH